jgi:hypothetical protein
MAIIGWLEILGAVTEVQVARGFFRVARGGNCLGIGIETQCARAFDLYVHVALH